MGFNSGFKVLIFAIIMFVNGVKSVLPHLFCVAVLLSNEQPVPRVWKFNINCFLIHTSFLRTLSRFFFLSRKHFLSISGLFGGARFRKFGPGFIGDDAR